LKIDRIQKKLWNASSALAQLNLIDSWLSLIQVLTLIVAYEPLHWK